MEILTVLNDLYYVNPEHVGRVWEQIADKCDRIIFKDGRKWVHLFARNIVSIEYYEELKDEHL